MLHDRFNCFKETKLEQLPKVTDEQVKKMRQTYQYRMEQLEDSQMELDYSNILHVIRRFMNTYYYTDHCITSSSKMISEFLVESVKYELKMKKE